MSNERIANVDQKELPDYSYSLFEFPNTKTMELAGHLIKNATSQKQHLSFEGRSSFSVRQKVSQLRSF